MIIGKSREAAAILTNMAIQHFHEISLSLNSNKSVSISTEHDPWMKGHFQLIHITIYSLSTKGRKFLIWELIFLIKYSYTEIK